MGFWKELWYGPETLDQRSSEPVVTDPADGIVIPRRDAFDSVVTPGESVRTLNVFRATQIISTSLTQLSFDAYKGDEVLDSPASFIIKPNVNTTREAFIEETVTSLALHGNAYWRVRRDDQSRVRNLEVLNPMEVSPVTNAAGTVTGYQWRGAEKPLPARDIQHLKFMRVPGQALGLGPIQAAQAELRGAIDVRNYASQWFDRSGMPSGILSTDQNITDEQAKAAAASWHNSPAGTVRVMGAGLDFKGIYLNPRDAQFIENRAFSTIEIARLFGIPPVLVNAAVEGTSMTYSNLSQVDVQFLKYTLTAYSREIEAALSDLLPRGTYARFNFEALLRPDVVTRYSMHEKAIRNGFMTPNEVRKIENLPPIVGGDVLYPPAGTTSNVEENN